MSKLLGRNKPIIGMIHLAPFPGTPFDEGLSNQQILDRAMRDRDVLLEAGFDAVSISNESDRPFVNDVPREDLALFTYLVTKLTDGLSIPFGCGVLIDPKASLAVARAVGAHFIRLSYGVTAGTFGLEVQAPGELLRYRRQIGATGVSLFLNVVPHLGTSLDTRPLAEIIHSAVSWTMPDAVQVGGPSAGALPDLEVVRTIKDRLPDFPVIVSSGVTIDTLPRALDIGDAIIVGTSLKVDGKTWNPVDPARVKAFMAKVRDIRSKTVLSR